METPRAVLSVKDGVFVISFYSVRVYVEDDKGCEKCIEKDHVLTVYNPAFVVLEPRKDKAVPTGRVIDSRQPREH